MKRGILKMDKILNFQVSLFGRFIDIKPKTDIILKLQAETLNHIMTY